MDDTSSSGCFDGDELIRERRTRAHMTTTIASRLQAVHDRIATVAQSLGRQPGELTLLAASKTNPAERLREAWQAGQRIFGENYLQEALVKMQHLTDLPIEWHFIGPIQSNKTRRIAENFSWVHSVDRKKIADRLSKDRSESLPPLQICLQVNVSGEASKSGVAPVWLPKTWQVWPHMPFACHA